MIDRDHLDQAGLEALGWLDDTERADFEHECLINPDLRATRAEVRDLIAAVAATAPPAAPSPQALAGIFARVSVPGAAVRSSSGSAWLQRSAASGLPWAAAAGFALLAAWMSWRSHETTLRWRQQLLEGFGGSEPAPGRVSQPGARGTGGSSANGTGVSGDPSARRPSGPRSAPLQYFTNRPGDPEARLQQDMGALRTEVAKLRAAEDARQQLPSGISDLRVVEMLPPGAKKPQEKNDLLSARVTEAIASGLAAPAPSSPDPKSPETPAVPEPIRLRGHGTGPAADFEIVDGDLVNLATLNLHPDAQVVHKNFPPPEDYARLGLTLLDNQTVYDGQGGLWHRAADGSWIGQKAPDNWSPPDPDEVASGPAPRLRPAPTPLKSPSSTGTATPETTAEPAMPYALPVLDHQGHGKLIVQNLPPAPDGESYHLWMMDPRFSGPVSVGVLPPMETAYDHFGFNLGTPGFVPTGYLLTLEKAGAADPPKAPSNTIVLQGP